MLLLSLLQQLRETLDAWTGVPGSLGVSRSWENCCIMNDSVPYQRF
jgi:hypothetical protein